MANYQELLRKALAALPENNGTARREVYERARRALVSQLRGVNPPLPAREITQHRLELEDCIRNVENEVTEIILSGQAPTDGGKSGGFEPHFEMPGAQNGLEDSPEERAPMPSEPAPKSNPAELSLDDLTPNIPVQTPAPAPQANPAPPVAAAQPATSPQALAAASPEVPNAAEADYFEQSGGAPRKTTASTISDIISRAEAERDAQNEELEQVSTPAPVPPISPAAPPQEAFEDYAQAELPQPETVQDVPAEPEYEDEEQDLQARLEEARKNDPRRKRNPSPQEIIQQASALAGGGAPSAEPGFSNGAVEDDFAPVEDEPSEFAQVYGAIEQKSASFGQSQNIDEEPLRSGSDNGFAQEEIARSDVREVELEDSLLEPGGGSLHASSSEFEAQSHVDRAIEMLDREVRGEVDQSYDNEAYQEDPYADAGFSDEIGSVGGEPVAPQRGNAKAKKKPKKKLKSPFSGLGSRKRATDTLKPEPETDARFASQPQPFAPVEQEEYAPAQPEQFDGFGGGSNGFTSGPKEPRGGNPMVMFLSITIVLLIIVSGLGYWALREGFLPIDEIFSSDPAETTTVADAGNAPATSDGEGPGNTTTSADGSQPVDQQVSIDGSDGADERLPGADAQSSDGSKDDERLVTQDTRPQDPAIDSDQGTVVAGTGGQSLLLEAASDGRTGAVPFAGSVEWTKGADEQGLPTLVGSATIPARNLSVQVLVRKNADQSLPASHLIEITFGVSESFIGGSIASFGGVLFKDEQLVPGKALIGAPARIFENIFLFALGASAQDVASNIELLRDRKWMDLALVYGTGRQAIVTLEKDTEAQALFEEVIAAWEG